jgi:hypothetical protein
MKIAFLPRDIVIIKGLENAPGIVIQTLLGLTGITYEVRYWHNGEAKTVWLVEDELARHNSLP